MTLVQLAGSLPRNPRFREWVAERYEWDADRITEQWAAEYIRTACGIESRRLIGTDADAAQRFNDRIRKPYLSWVEQQQQPA